MKRRKVDDLERALDTVRFGAQNILNLRDSLPTPEDAAHRAEKWLRQKQVERVGQVLVVTGRGRNSERGISPVREAIVRLIASLRRRNVIERYEEHTAGSFDIKLAAIRADPAAGPMRTTTEASLPRIPELTSISRQMLRDLAERSLEGVGIKDTHAFLADEMLLQLRAILSGLPPGPIEEAQLRAALRAALDRTP